MEAVTLESSEEHINQNDSDGSLSPGALSDMTASDSAALGKRSRSDDGGSPTDSLVAFGALDEGRPGERPAEGQADAFTKALKKRLVTDSGSGLEAKDTR